MKMMRLSYRRFRSNEKAMVEFDRLPSWQSVAAMPFGPGAVEEDRRLVADEFAAAAVCSDGAKDCRLAGDDRVAAAVVANQLIRREATDGEVSEKSTARAAFAGCGFPMKGTAGCFGTHHEGPGVRVCLDQPFAAWSGAYCRPMRTQDGNPSQDLPAVHWRSKPSTTSLANGPTPCTDHQLYEK